MAERLRAEPGSFGFVGANGGFMSRYAVGIYSTAPAEFRPADNRALQAEINALPGPSIAERPIGPARIETYTVEYDRSGCPSSGLIIGQPDDGSRFVANVAESDAETLARLADERAEPIGMIGHVGPGSDGRNLFRPGNEAALAVPCS